MGERDQQQAGGADDEREDAEVKEECAGQVQLAEKRHIELGGVRSQERMRKQPGTGARGDGEQQPRADPAQRPDPKAVLRRARAAGHVLQDHAHRQRDPGDEAAAREVVAAEQEIQGEQADGGKHEAHDHRRHQQVLGDAGRALLALLLGRLDAFSRGTEAAQKGIHRHRNHTEHGDLAEGIQAAEVDDDHIHHVRSAAAWISLRDKEAGNRVIGQRPSHHSVRKRGEARARSNCDYRVEEPARRRRKRRGASGDEGQPLG